MPIEHLNSIAYGNSSRDIPKDASIEEVAKEFEAILLTQLLQLMRKSVVSSGLFDDAPGKDVYMGMMNTEMARALVFKGRGLGLSEHIRQSLQGLVPAQPEPGKPVSSYPLTSNMGWRKDPLNGEWRYHNTNLRHTIRRRQGKILVRVSDILIDAPQPVLEALLCILLHKLFGESAPPDQRRIYRHYAADSRIRARVRQVRSSRGRKRLSGPQGKVFNLQAVFSALNERYFVGQLQVRNLSWSPNCSRRVLGHYDPAHDTIVVSRRLDDSRIPRFVIDFVVYHEMLHALLDDHARGTSRRTHSPAFRRAELRFSGLQQAQAFLENRLCLSA